MTSPKYWFRKRPWHPHDLHCPVSQDEIYDRDIWQLQEEMRVDRNTNIAISVAGVAAFFGAMYLYMKL